jgi:hypothetical protein
MRPRSRHPIRIAIAVLALASGLAACVASAAAKKQGKVDAIWTHPAFAQSGVDRIAFVPPATYDNSLPNENLIESVVGASLKGTGYRWLSGTSTRDLLRSRTGSDSLLRSVKDAILAGARVDSVQASALCAMLACDALLSVRADQWEQITPEWNQAGKPSTSIQLRAALVDSAGRLLWSAAGGQTAEGPYYDPSTNPTGVRDSGLDRKPITSQAGAPSYRETLTALVSRWVPHFPPPPAATPRDSTAAPARN